MKPALSITIGLSIALGCAASARAEPPVPTTSAYVQGLLTGWYVPQAQAFAQQADGLVQSTSAYCAGGPLAPARSAWRDTMLAWSRLSTVAIGPLIGRRSARRIDFGPVRPELLKRAIASEPGDEAAMERVGSPAKGFPALEALLWPKAPAANSPACNYAMQVAADIAREAHALADDFEASTHDAREAADDTAALSEAVNQWIGGLEALRLQAFERPLLERAARNAARPVLPRAASGASAAERDARWQALRTQAVGDGRADAGGLVALDAYLRGQGDASAAQALAAAVRRAGKEIDAARSDAPPALRSAARSLAALKARAEADVAPALGITLGFTDADGD